MLQMGNGTLPDDSGLYLYYKNNSFNNAGIKTKCSNCILLLLYNCIL